MFIYPVNFFILKIKIPNNNKNLNVNPKNS